MLGCETLGCGLRAQHEGACARVSGLRLCVVCHKVLARDNTSGEHAACRLGKEVEQLTKLLDRVYKAYHREGWEQDGEDLYGVFSTVAWELYDKDDAPLTRGK